MKNVYMFWVLASYWISQFLTVSFVTVTEAGWEDPNKIGYISICFWVVLIVVPYIISILKDKLKTHGKVIW